MARRDDIAKWADRYVGIRFADHGRALSLDEARGGLDCWGLARLVAAEQLGLVLPAYDEGYASADERAAVARLISAGMADWRPVPDGGCRAGDFAALRGRRREPVSHVGVLVGPAHLLHIERGTASVVVPLDHPTVKRRLAGIYRHVSLWDNPAGYRGGDHAQGHSDRAGSGVDELREPRRGPAAGAGAGDDVERGLPLDRRVHRPGESGAHASHRRSGADRLSDFCPARGNNTAPDRHRHGDPGTPPGATDAGGGLRRVRTAHEILRGESHRGPLEEVLAPGEGAVRLTAIPNPFTTERVERSYPAGATLAEMVADVLPDGRRARVLLGDMAVPRENWRLVRPKPGAQVIVRAVPRDGGGGKKDPLRTVLMIAVIIAAAVIAPEIALALELTEGTIAFKIVEGIAAAAITFAGMALVNAIVPPAQPRLPNLSAQPADSPTLYLTGARNDARPFGVVPIVLGRHRMFPPLAARHFTELVGDDQYLRMLVCWGYGPLAITDIKIGETPLAEFEDVEIETVLGYPDDPPLTLYSDSVFEEALSVQLTQAADWQVRTSQAEADELSVDISFPNGLAHFADDGSRQSRTVTVEVEYSPAGAEDWTAVETLTVTASRTSAIRKGARWTVAQGQYDVRLRRVTPDTDSARTVDLSFWSALRTIRAVDPVRMPGLALSALRIRATNQLSGVVDRLNGICALIAPDWDADGETWVARETANPAALYRALLQHPANARPAPDGRIDLAQIEHWHELCEQHGRRFNMVVDYPTSVRQLMADVAAAGRATPSRRDALHSVVIDEPKASRVQLFTPRNSWGFQGEKAFVEPPHAWRVRFVNEEKSWLQDERIVYFDGYGPLTATRFEGLELPGVTHTDQIWLDARYRMADGLLRPETFSWFADVEHIVCTRGDWVAIAHDVLLAGLAWGRIKEVLWDAEEENVVGLALDEALPMEAGGDYGLVIRTLQNPSLTVGLTTEAGDQRTVALAAPLPAAGAPEAGDLFAFGELGRETLDVLVKRIEPGPDLTARIVAVPLAPAVHEAGALPRDFAPADVDAEADTIALAGGTPDAGHGLFDGDVVRLATTGTLPGGLAAATDYWIVNADAETVQLAAEDGGAPVDIADGGAGTHTVTRRIPDYDSGMTPPAELAAPQVAQMRSDGTVLYRDADGSWLSQILVTFHRGAAVAAGVAGIETAYRPLGSDGPWLSLPAQDPEGGEIGVRPVEDGETYALRFRAVLQDGRRSDWSGIETHTVIGKSAPPNDVTGFSAQQVGSGVTFRWSQVPDRDLQGYEIRYALQGQFVWDDATAVTRVTRGTLITNEGLPPGDWTVGIKAKDTSGNFSQNAALFDIDVANVFDAIETVEHAPRWVPYLNDGFVVHWPTAKLVPDSQALAADLSDDELWDHVVWDPVAEATWEGREIDLGFDARATRAWADIQWALVPGGSESPDVGLEVDFRDDAAAYDGFAPWTLGRFDGRFVTPRIRAAIPGPHGVPTISGFTFTADGEERSEGASGVTIAPGGTAIVFAQRFHQLGRISITPDADASGGVRVPAYSAKSTAGFTAHLYDLGGNDVGGVADWDATGV